MPTILVVQGVVAFHAGKPPGWQILLILGGVFGGDMTINIKASAGVWPLAGLRIGAPGGPDE